MKILYFYQFFSTPQGAWGTRVYEFAKNWVEKGHEVTIVTSIFDKSDITSRKFIESQIIDGINLRIVRIKISNRQIFLKRVWTWFIYMVVSCWYAIITPADVVVASSGPITVGIPGLIAKFLCGKDFIFEVRDLWPQGAIEMGLLKNKFLIKIAYWFEKCYYMTASYIIALSPGMVDNILKRYPNRKIVSVPNSANIELFSSPSVFDIGEFKNKKYAIYMGNIGPVNNSDWLYDAAKILKEKGRNDILILLFGDGQSRVLLQKKAKENNIDNIVFFGLAPKVNLVAYLQCAMVALVPLKGIPVLDTSSPNKLFESLAAGIPVIQNTNGWIKDLLEEYNIGFTLDPNDANALAELLIKIADGHTNINVMKYQAKMIARVQFNKDYLAEKMLSILEEVALAERQ
jgi:glycosyltransferase involved in cell wall biosynthesis